MMQANQEQGNQQAKGGQDLLPVLLALAAGIAIGMNWQRIQKFINPYIAALKGKGTDAYANLIRVLSEQKEAASDFIAERKIANKKKG